ncbi:MAG: site-2 protease family protein [Candidatus Moranbacteria bacterium]|nr:site-2 protease family protein [Candidatus Moranbacteria bacterium]
MEIIIAIGVLIFSVIIHEVAHGLSAFWQGDPTAKYAGRLTLNPVKHLDPVGSIILPLLLVVTQAGIIIGWAKPVPYNPYNLRDQKYGPALVSVAGPLSNLIFALVCGIFFNLFLKLGIGGDLVFSVFSYAIYINLLLMVFNLLPIPPLDGSKLLFTFLPISEHTKQVMEQYGFIFILVFVFMFFPVIFSLVQFVMNIFSEYIVGINIMRFMGF